MNLEATCRKMKRLQINKTYVFYGIVLIKKEIMMINILIFEAQKFTLYKNKKATSLRDGYMIVSFKRTFFLVISKLLNKEIMSAPRKTFLFSVIQQQILIHTHTHNFFRVSGIIS